MKATLKSGFTQVLVAVTLLVTPLAMGSAIAQRPPVFAELDLTSEQQADLQALFQSRRAEIDNILTDAQQQQFQEAYRELQDFQAAVGEVDNLTEAQKQEIQTVVQGSREEIREILTDEQLRELRALLQERRRN